MLAYPVYVEEDDDTVLFTSPDFPELTTFGKDRDEAIARASDAFEEAIAARIHDRKDIPKPSEGSAYTVLPTLTAIKVLLYQGMRDQGVGKAELARRLGMATPESRPRAGYSTPLQAGPDGRRPERDRHQTSSDRVLECRPEIVPTAA